MSRRADARRGDGDHHCTSGGSNGSPGRAVGCPRRCHGVSMSRTTRPDRRSAACEDAAWLLDGTAPGSAEQTGAVAPPAAPRSPSASAQAALATADMVLNIGPQHPSTHGVLRLRITLDGERITRAEPIVGYMHRGAEKLFEVRDYRQIIVLANRHDWLSAFANELGVVLAAERMLGMEVPERAVWARTLLAELNRVLNHLMFLGSYPLELGAITPVFYAFREREELQAVMEEVSGGRMHYMFNRVGGLKEDLPAGWTARVLHAVGDRPGPAAAARGADRRQRDPAGAHARRRRPAARPGRRRTA